MHSALGGQRPVKRQQIPHRVRGFRDFSARLGCRSWSVLQTDATKIRPLAPAIAAWCACNTEPRIVPCGTKHIPSLRGVQQGDNNDPLMFALALHVASEDEAADEFAVRRHSIEKRFIQCLSSLLHAPLTEKICLLAQYFLNSPAVFIASTDSTEALCLEPKFGPRECLKALRRRIESETVCSLAVCSHSRKFRPALCDAPL